MKFKSILRDIEKLRGLKLSSIKPGSEITIDRVDSDNKRILLTTYCGKKNSRPFSELERLWEILCLEKVLHVETALGGSGSSRNQPETIMANLPYVEWFKYARKKHLALLDSPSHPLGSLKRMDLVAEEEIKLKLAAKSNNFIPSSTCQTILVSKDLKSHSNALEQISGVSGKNIKQGIYEYCMPTCQLLLISNKLVPEFMLEGIYLVIPNSPLLGAGKHVKINGQNYTLQITGGLNILFTK
ncbi:hypothetical protein ACFLZ5_04605 [Thermodesulfobacteriota bacterium]